MQNTYEIDPVHSTLQFTVRHMMIANVRGIFKNVKGTVLYDPENPSAAKIDAEIEASTLDTHNADRDAHVKSAEFLDVEKFPTITFKSKNVKPSGAGLEVTGDLTIHGVTKEAKLDVTEVSQEAKDPWGNARVGANAKTKVSRKEFGLHWNAPLETGGVVLGDEVNLEFEVELIKK